ncbi:hypothetical protein N9242_04775 [Vicingaceae bacterium]|nr:hypothetical protein [Vicingaceae bacterium]
MSQRDYQENVFQVDSPSEIPVDRFNETMQRDTFACIRGIVSPEDVKSGMEALTNRFSVENDHPGVGQSADRVRTNFQKLNVGGESNARSNDDARLFRAFYNPIWEDDIYNMRETFIKLAQVRNVIAEMPLDFAIDKIEDNGLWTAARIHQYPAGGGFFRRHTDYVVKDVADEAGAKFYQLLLLMSAKGEDFHEGGGFVDVDGERVILEDYFVPGDILIYDGRSVHGVEDIDPHLTLDLSKFNGRVSAFVTLFKVMN